MPTTLVADTPTVPAILPLSLLEAIRNLDTPVEDGLAELAGEMVAKRLGLSPTVSAQIARYQEMVKRDGMVTLEEALSVFRLVDRRPDAPLVFADAGRRAARHGLKASRLAVRANVSGVPGFVSRTVGLRAASGVAKRIFGAQLQIQGPMAVASVSTPLAIEVAARGKGCAMYGAAFGELLRNQIGFEGAMVHEQCRSRGDAVCQWRGTHTPDYG